MIFLAAEAPAFDWFNAVFLPTAITVVVGGPLAIYTGLVGSRLVTFQQTRAAGLLDLVVLVKDVRPHTTVHDVDATINYLLQTMQHNFLADHQFRLWIQITAIRRKISDEYERQKHLMTESGRHSFRSGTLRHWYIVVQTDAQFQDWVAFHALTNMQGLITETISQIVAMKPDMKPILRCDIDEFIDFERVTSKKDDGDQGKVL